MAESTPRTFSVTISEEGDGHIHKGIPRKTGATIEVSDTDKVWLGNMGLIEQKGATAANKANAEEKS
ncbi:hypothetical protein [Endothiovibrio diazotrophicus]